MGSKLARNMSFATWYECSVMTSPGSSVAVLLAQDAIVANVVAEKSMKKADESSANSPVLNGRFGAFRIVT